jgi:membrane protein implicated in regulation of membrane protease activity
MAAFFLLLAILGGALIGDLVWENTTAGEVTVFGRTAVSYPQGWLLLVAAALGFVVALLLVASVSATKARRTRRRQLRSMKRNLQHEGIETEEEYAKWLDESFGRREGAADAHESLKPQTEPLYEQSRRAAGLREDHRR